MTCVRGRPQTQPVDNMATFQPVDFRVVNIRELDVDNDEITLVEDAQTATAPMPMGRSTIVSKLAKGHGLATGDVYTSTLAAKV